MSLLFPMKYTEIFINKDKENVLENIKMNTEKYKPVRFIFSKHKHFEGEVLQDELNLIYIGKLARPYRVKIYGRIVDSDTGTLLKLTTWVTSFGLVSSYIWLYGLIIFILFSLYISISHKQIIVLAITLVAILLLIIGIQYAVYGYKHETDKVLKLIKKIAGGTN